MYSVSSRNSELFKRAHGLAATQLAHLLHRRSDLATDEAPSFLAREILRLQREGESDTQRLANRAISLLREHIQKRESALRLTSTPD